MKDLIDRLKPVIVKDGRFVFNSGLVSYKKIDMNALAGHPGLRNDVAVRLWKRIQESMTGLTCIAGCGYGGMPLVDIMGSMYHIKSCVVRDIPKKDGSMIEGPSPTKDDITVLVDDVLTTGGTLIRARKVIESVGCRVAGYFVVANWEEYNLDIFNPTTLEVPFGYLFTARDLGIDVALVKSN